MNKKIIPDWKLERYLLGELPRREIEVIREMEWGDRELRGRITAMKASDAEILEKYPAEKMGRKIESAHGGNQSRPVSVPVSGLTRSTRLAPVNRSKLWIPRKVSRWAVPAFVCVMAILIIPMYMISSSESSLTNASYAYEDRVKGMNPAIEVWRKAGESAEKLGPDAVAREGDIVQLRYVVPEFCYGALVSMDGRGVLTVHLSGESGKAVPLTPGKPTALNASYELDDAPHFEAFYLITASEIFELDAVKQSLKKADHPLDNNENLSLPQHQQVTMFTLRKN
jgi:hypothetical protein